MGSKSPQVCLDGQQKSTSVVRWAAKVHKCVEMGSKSPQVCSDGQQKSTSVFKWAAKVHKCVQMSSKSPQVWSDGQQNRLSNRVSRTEQLIKGLTDTLVLKQEPREQSIKLLYSLRLARNATGARTRLT
jgi:hypothetical protein